MLSWKAIVFIALLIGLFVVAYIRDRFKNTISVMGPVKGYPLAFASAYRPFSFLFGYPNNQVPYAITWWMENGANPTQTDADTIQYMVDNSECTPQQAWSVVQCNIQFPEGQGPDQCPTSPPCGSDNQPSATGTNWINDFYQYAVPLIGLGMMAL